MTLLPSVALSTVITQLIDAAKQVGRDETDPRTDPDWERLRMARGELEATLDLLFRPVEYDVRH